MWVNSWCCSDQKYNLYWGQPHGPLWQAGLRSTKRQEISHLNASWVSYLPPITLRLICCAAEPLLQWDLISSRLQWTMSGKWNKWNKSKWKECVKSSPSTSEPAYFHPGLPSLQWGLFCPEEKKKGGELLACMCKIGRHLSDDWGKKTFHLCLQNMKFVCSPTHKKN